MNSKRKAELQRKLSLAPMPKPPEGLSERIKADIPRYLNVEGERDRFSRSMAFNLRVAASILLLISGLFVTMRVFESGDREKVMPPRSVVTATTPAAASAPTETIRVDMAEARPVTTASAQLDYAPPAPRALPARTQALDEAKPVVQLADARERDSDGVEGGVSGTVMGGVAGGVVGGTVGGVAGGAIAQPAEIARAEELPAPPPPPPAAPAVSMPPPEPAPAPVPVRTASADTANAAAPSLMRKTAHIIPDAQAAALDMGPRDRVFGLSVDRQAFERVKSTIEGGRRPSDVNVEALVNYFAGPAKKARRDVSLQVEGSPAPVDVEGHRAILRYTIDTATMDLPPNASTPPVATDATIEVIIDPGAVDTFRPVGEHAGLIANEPSLLKNTSVTGLVELSLRSGISSRQHVATVRVTYRSVSDGRQHKVEQALYGKDFARTWASASRRHRLASLGAVWGETLKGSTGDTDVAKRAEELATQEPKDEKARELATLASASSRLRSSAPTGSGR